MYSHSPEDIVVEQEDRKPLQESIQSAFSKFPDRRDRIFSLHECGYKNVEIAEMLGISRHIVGREVNRAEQELKDKFTEDGLNGTPVST